MDRRQTAHQHRRLDQRALLPWCMVAAVPMFVAVTGCSHAVTDAPSTATVSFSYAGPVSGSFQAQGAPRLDVPPLSQTYAQGLKYQNPDGLEVEASSVHATSGSTTST